MLRTGISYQEALDQILAAVPRGGPEEVPLADLVGRTLAEDVASRVDSPSVDASLKDGFAVQSQDVSSADPDHPVRLKLIGALSAGEQPGRTLAGGTAIRVMTGAPLPRGSDAVLAGEFAREEGGAIWCTRDAGPGRNILARGTDVRAGQILARRGQRLHPALIGLLAAAGLDRVPVVIRPRVAIIGTGDEVVAPGRPLPQGKLYASNIVETMAWLRAFGLTEVTARVVPDRAEEITSAIRDLSDRVDAFVTSGGAWGSERDLMLVLLKKMGWRGIFSRVRLGPGKAVSFGFLEHRPFFILPGGPPSHEAALLLLALPGLMAMAGWPGPVFPRLSARLIEPMQGRAAWTQCLHVQLFIRHGECLARPVKAASRLSSMADKNGLVLLPEGTADIPAGRQVEVQVLAGLDQFFV